MGPKIRSAGEPALWAEGSPMTAKKSRKSSRAAAERPLQTAKRVDRHVGVMMRQRRKELGLTQQGLAAQLDISYQQIQKYESGTNRVSAGRLYILAEILGVDLSYFFRELPESDARPVRAEPATGSPELVARDFQEIREPMVRAALFGLVKALRENGRR